LEKDPNNVRAKIALTELLASLEKIIPKLAKEKAEYESAERLMVELQQAADQVAKELLGLREQINQSKTTIKEAEMDVDRQRKAAEKAEKLAGLRNATNKFDVALGALNKQVEQKQKEAESFRIVAEQLRKPAEEVSEAASLYMEQVSNTSTPTETLQEKLARLKASTGK
jgi:chromosome segregation ATPase